MWKLNTSTLVTLLGAIAPFQAVSLVGVTPSSMYGTTMTHGSGFKRKGLSRLSVARVLHAVPSNQLPPSEDLVQLPPVDETYSLFGAVRELLAAPVPPLKARRYDGVGSETGGVWRSRVLGILPRTVSSRVVIRLTAPHFALIFSTQEVPVFVFWLQERAQTRHPSPITFLRNFFGVRHLRVDVYQFDSSSINNCKHAAPCRTRAINVIIW